MAHTGPPANSTAAHTPLVHEDWKRERREEEEEVGEEGEGEESDDFLFDPSLK